MEYKFIIKQKKIFDYTRQPFKETIETYICTIDEQGIVLPHPITSFIRTNFSRYSINTQKRYGEELKKFLNYLVENIKCNNNLFMDLKTYGISKLSVKHGSEYLKLLSSKVRAGNLKSNNFYFSERVLVQFYVWLDNQNLIEETIQFKEKVVMHNNISKTILDSPFTRLDLAVAYPKRERGSSIRKRKLHDFGYGRLDLVNLFLKIAELEEPDIAFGIALQFYGGLRKGEVINLTINSIREEKYANYTPLIVNIKDNWESIFENKTVTNAEQVKREREQIIFKVNIVKKLYNQHLLKIKKESIKNRKALFISYKSNKPICGQVYYKKFNNVKEKFLEVVLLNSSEDYNRLISKPWSTHIGRGIFTNLLVFDLGWNASEIALARGDKSLISSQTYIEENNLINITNKAISRLEELAINRGDVSAGS